MQERLDILTLQPKVWGDWNPQQGGLEAHRSLAGRYSNSVSNLLFDTCGCPQAAIDNIAKYLSLPLDQGSTGLSNPPSITAYGVAAPMIKHAWWDRLLALLPKPKPELKTHRAVLLDDPVQAQSAEGSLDLLWANMALHSAPDPEALMQRWAGLLQTDGILMFSALGPDSLRELRGLYATLGWPPPMHDFTDMHDWGDMLITQGFSDPVLDVEHITLTFQTPSRLLEELRGLGRNLHRQRFAGLRGKGWQAQLMAQMDQHLRLPGVDAGEQSENQAVPLSLTFEIVYGHAVKAAKKLAVQGELSLSLDDMRAQLRRGRIRP
jgi:malonyl-CoA O-methyltransferase